MPYTIDGREVENIRIAGVNRRDYPDFVDAYIDSANFADNGQPLADFQLAVLTEEYQSSGDMSYHACRDMFDRIMQR